ncbi:MAG: DUF4956 domain-containing protein [Gammaproteobacteria bacterium]|nr:DUF4956 domain-containing protein [Gammaproteobacteria bacterium]
MPTDVTTTAAQQLQQQLLASLHTGAFGPFEMLLNMSLALMLGLLLASVYRHTHKGLSYSQSFALTIVFVTMIVSISLMAIESSLARAFALVGALSIIRFRTVVKDTKDTAYVFAGLAVGLAAGTNNYYLATMAGVFIPAVALVLHRTNFGASSKNDFVLRFTFDRGEDSSRYLDALEKDSRYSTLLHAEPAGDGQSMILAYDVSLKRNIDTSRFAVEFSRLAGISEVSLVAAKTDVDY